MMRFSLFNWIIFIVIFYSIPNMLFLNFCAMTTKIRIIFSKFSIIRIFFT